MLVPVFCFAQKIVKHTVVASESFTSIAKKYNVNGRAIATFNNLNYEKGLTIGQELKIQLPKAATKVPILKEPVPVKDTKVVKEKPLPIKEKVKTEPSKTGAATKHLVGAKETLYGISKIYGITVADIHEHWLLCAI